MVKESDLKKEELYDKGIYAYKNNNYEEALNLFNEAIVCDGKFYKAKIAKVDCLYKMGRLNEVHPICTEIFSSDCLDEEVWYKLGDFYYNVGRMFENALDCFNKAIELKEDYADAWDMKGSALSFMANFEEALNSHNKAAELNPDNPNIYDNIGYCYASLGMFDNALEAYDKALEIDSHDINALSNKASILNNMGKSEEALNYIKRALEIKEDYNLLYYKAVALFTLEKYEDSLEAINRSLELYNFNHNGWKFKGQLLIEMENYKEAIIAYDKVISYDPSDIQGWFYMITSLVNLGMLEEALAGCDEVLKRNSDVFFIFEKANILYELNRLDESLEICNNRLSIDEFDSDFYLLKAKIYNKKQDKKKAIEFTEKAIEYNPIMEEAISFREELLNQ